MLRTALLFFLLLGFVSSEIQAATATASTYRPIHRRKPTAGNYVPVYRQYRGPGRHKNRFGGWFKRHKSASKHRTSHKSRRGTL